jgi:hypothetical protein
VIASNHAVRLGLRAASRNPELAFWRALLDQAASLLSLLPVLLAALFVMGALDADLLSFGRTLLALGWPTLGGVAAALCLSFVAGIGFWAGALPLLAADIELDRRPPSGNFALLAGRGFARVFSSGLLAQLLSLLVTAGLGLALVAGLARFAAHPSTSRMAAIALAVALAFAMAVFVDLLTKLWMLRAAAFGEGPSAAFGSAAQLLSARLGQGVIVSAAFFLLELIAAAVSGGLAGMFSGPALLEPDTAAVAIIPRIALGLAFAAVFSWLEVGKMAALAASACDAEGLLGPSSPPPDSRVEPHSAERVIEALPVEPIIEALPAEPVIEALPVDDEHSVGNEHQHAIDAENADEDADDS